MFFLSCDVAAFFQVKEYPSYCAKSDVCCFGDFTVRRIEEFWFTQKDKYEANRGRRAPIFSAHCLFCRSCRFFASYIHMQAGFMKISVSGNVQESQIQFPTLSGDFSGYVGRKQ